MAQEVPTAGVEGRTFHTCGPRMHLPWELDSVIYSYTLFSVFGRSHCSLEILPSRTFSRQTPFNEYSLTLIPFGHILMSIINNVKVY